MKLQSLKSFEALNSEEIKVIKGGLVAGSTVECDSGDKDKVKTKLAEL
ncbi:hypothetical protein [Elizabethkingia anophelis]|uniref:Bacteriocin n=2 Tax=Elizabethkingia anophelis TaxID=1117645 RepID=A0A455ZEY4_9FLAO|nr:hypothetical protein [Elizabethkingia anophelis]AIL46946.1 hypothetical protein BD94_3171 [Elizabethkingia anophelis NUHP1]DAC75397.1 TPA_exp: hypothetical protein [Elizabethkingia anophelis]